MPYRDEREIANLKDQLDKAGAAHDAALNRIAVLEEENRKLTTDYFEASRFSYNQPLWFFFGLMLIVGVGAAIALASY